MWLANEVSCLSNAAAEISLRTSAISQKLLLAAQAFPRRQYIWRAKNLVRTAQRRGPVESVQSVGFEARREYAALLPTVPAPQIFWDRDRMGAVAVGAIAALVRPNHDEQGRSLPPVPKSTGPASRRRTRLPPAVDRISGQAATRNLLIAALSCLVLRSVSAG